MRALVGLSFVAALALPARAEPPLPWLGISFQSLGGGGAVVTEVHPGTPAAAAGLMPNDLLVRADGRPVVDLAVQIRAAGIGQRFPLVVDRDGRRLLITPRLAARPTPDEIVHLLLVGHDLPPLAATDELGQAVRREWWRGAPMVLVVLDARCDGCAAAVAGLQGELAARGVVDDVRLRAVVLANSAAEFHALLTLVPLPVAAWWVARGDAAGLLGALERREDGAVLVADAGGRIRYAAALSSGALAHDGACQVVAGLLAPR